MEIRSPKWILPAKIKVLAKLRSFWTLGESPFPYHLHLLETACPLWLMAPSSVFRPAVWCLQTSLSILPPSFTSKGPCDYTEIHLGNGGNFPHPLP